MNKRSIKIPERCSAQIKEMWEDSEGFWAAAAPGWCFDTLSGYLLFAETEEELMAEAGSRIRPEEYEVQDLDGQRGSVISYERACKQFHELLRACDGIKIVCQEYAPSCFLERNRYMAGESQRVIAVYDGRERGGTLFTMRYAHSIGREVREIRV